MASAPTKQLTAVGSAELAYRHIRDAIVHGRYRPGQRLIEQRISEEFGLSRTPVREGLRRLEAEGLVITERNRGAVVRPVTAGDIDDLYELRATLEGLAARRAAMRAEATDIDALDAAIKAYDEGAQAVDLPEIEIVRRVDAANQDFHAAVLRIAAHPRLEHVITKAVDLPLGFHAMRIFSPSRRALSNMFHQLIRDAIAAHNHDRAERLMTEHILMGRDALVSHLDEQTDGVAVPLFNAGAS